MWTKECLTEIGLTSASLLGSDPTMDLVSAVPLQRLIPKDFEIFGIDPNGCVPDDFIFKKVSDNGANIKGAWDKDGKWIPCFPHTLELCTLPFTYCHKHATVNQSLPRGSIPESFGKARGLVGYLHHSTIGKPPPPPPPCMCGGTHHTSTAPLLFFRFGRFPRLPEACGARRKQHPPRREDKVAHRIPNGGSNCLQQICCA